MAIIPYERQAWQRSCGAASLCMVYRSLGVADCSQDAVHAAVRFGPAEQAGARTHWLARDALGRGLVAQIVQVARSAPWALLERALGHGLRVVLNHRTTATGQAGHFSVLLGLQGESARLHDPRQGPDLEVPRQDLLALWAPALVWPFPEAVGLIALLFGTKETAPEAETRCGRCRERVPLGLTASLGCERPGGGGGGGGLWLRGFCPWCDQAFES